jgi:hypothetical protein
MVPFDRCFLHDYRIVDPKSKVFLRSNTNLAKNVK